VKEFEVRRLVQKAIKIERFGESAKFLIVLDDGQNSKMIHPPVNLQDANDRAESLSRILYNAILNAVRGQKEASA
jgi:hypothetical protein